MVVMSEFTIKAHGEGGTIILKNTKTGAVVRLSDAQFQHLQEWLSHQELVVPNFVADLVGQNGILVDDSVDEFVQWRESMVDARDNRARIFSLHFEPTIQCQLRCDYCFENGIDRGKGMTEEVFLRSVDWLDRYFVEHPEVEVLRLIFFGGEPLLRKDIVRRSLGVYSKLAEKHQLEYITEIITNGELLTEDVAQFFSGYNWKRVQITLDGPREIHDARRHGESGRPTFEAVWQNVLMLARTSYVSAIDIRLSMDRGNAEHIPRLLEFMADSGVQEKIRLSIGFTESSFYVTIKEVEEKWQAKQALHVWGVARNLGFKIPDEYASGPLCVAQAKHSAVLQPDGNLQKCFCTSGQNEHAFGSVFKNSDTYTRDVRYENWKRLDQCIEERCPYLPVCGGGCTYHAVVEHGQTTESFAERHCKRTLLREMNEGLLRLSYQSVRG